MKKLIDLILRIVADIVFLPFILVMALIFWFKEEDRTVREKFFFVETGVMIVFGGYLFYCLVDLIFETIR